MPGLFDGFPVLFAQAPAAAANPNAAMWTFLPYVAIIGLWFYLLLIRPQQKQEKQRREMLGAMKKNDRVITASGIYGTVMSVDENEDRVVIRIDDDKGVKVTFTKGSIVRVIDGSAPESKAVKAKGQPAEGVGG